MKSARPSPSGEWDLPEQSSSAAFVRELHEEPPGNADGRLAAFSPSAPGEEESRSDQNPPSHSHSRVMGQRAAGSHGGFLPSLCRPCWLSWTHCLFAARGWKDAVVLGKLVACRTLMVLCACFSTLQQGNSGNSLWLIAHIAANAAESCLQTVPKKSLSTLALFFRPKRSMWMILMVVNTGVVFIICKEHPQGHVHAQPCCYGWRGPSPAAEEKQWRWQGHERDRTTLRATQQTSLSKWDEPVCGLKQYFSGGEPLKWLPGQSHISEPSLSLVRWVSRANVYTDMRSESLQSVFIIPV